MKLRSYLLETTFNPPAFADATDTSPPSTSIFGEKMVARQIDSVNGKMTRHESDPNFSYGEWEFSDGMDNFKHFHKSLRGLRSIIHRDDFAIDKNWSKENKEEGMRFEDNDDVKTLANSAIWTDEFAVSNFKDWKTIKRTLPIQRIGSDDTEYHILDIDKVVRRHL